MLYREAHVWLAHLSEAVVGGTRRGFMETLTTVALLIIGKSKAFVRPPLGTEHPGSEAE